MNATRGPHPQPPRFREDRGSTIAERGGETAPGGVCSSLNIPTRTVPGTLIERLDAIVLLSSVRLAKQLDAVVAIPLKEHRLIYVVVVPEVNADAKPLVRRTGMEVVGPGTGGRRR